MADLLGHLVEGWVTALGGSVIGSFQNQCHPPFPQCETVLSSLGARGGKRTPGGRKRGLGWGLQGLCLAGPSPLLSSLLFPLFLCTQTLKLAGGFPGRRCG